MISPRALVRSARVAAGPRASRRSTPWAALGAVPRTHLLWLAFWAPWWVGNDMALPSPPGSRLAPMREEREGSPGAWLLDQLDDLAFRFGLAWAVALVLRGAWLGGAVGILWAVTAQLAGLPIPSLRAILPLIAVGFSLGLVLRVLHRPRYEHLAAMLDGTFDLRSRVTTAVTALRLDADRPGSLHVLQLADAANALARSRALITREQWLPVREIFLACIVAVLLVFLLVAQRPEGEIPSASATGIPGFVPVSERLAGEREEAPPEVAPDAATLQEVEDLSRESNEARQDLDAVGDALDSLPVTLPAAEAIDAGDYGEAGDRLDAASEAVMTSPEMDRRALADELDAAADRVSEDNAALADAARQAADDARSGEDTGGLEALADQIEATGDSVISQESDGQDLGDASPPSEGQPGGAASGEAPQGQQSAPEGGGTESGPMSGDPGSGMAASGGVSDSAQPGETEGGAPTDGEGAEGGGSADAPAGQSSEATGDDPTGGSDAGGQSPGAASDASASSDSPGESAAQGSGAGGETQDGDGEDAADRGSAGGDLDNENISEEAGEGEASDDPPPGGDGTGDEEGELTGAAVTDAAVSLPGQSDDRVRSGANVGSSSVGSGGGIGAGSGDAVSGTSGSAGPDPNTVPEDLRPVVEDYFENGGAP